MKWGMGARGALTGLAAVAGTVTLAGCAFTQGLLPVGGLSPDIYFAQADVLVEQGVAVKTFPQCTMPEGSTLQTCTGETLDGQTITVTGDQGKDGMPFSITVGSDVIFQGTAAEVLAENGVQ